MAENDIEISEGCQSTDFAEGQLPINILKAGQLSSNDVHIYIKQNVYQDIEKYSRADTEHERGIFLIGTCLDQFGSTAVVISDYIEAKYTDASASTLTFTHDTWEYVHSEMDKKYNDKKIVGWQHTHPGYGIFLSNYDVFIHENFFNLPFQIAYVVDPLNDNRGFFQWKGGSIEKLEGYYIYDDPGKKLGLLKTVSKEKNNVKSSLFIKILLFGLIGVIIVLLCFVIMKTNDINNAALRQQEMQQIIDDADSMSDSLNEIFANHNIYIDGDFESGINGLFNTIEEKQTEIDSLEDTVREQSEKESEEVYIKYNVQKGDTLYKICKKLGIDYYKYKDEILSINGVRNADKIYYDDCLFFAKSMIEKENSTD